MSTMILQRELQTLLREAPTGELVYSCLAFHGPAQGDELPGVWVVAALQAVGIAPLATRQALFRLEREGHLATRRHGRSKWYRLTRSGQAQIAAGRDRLTRIIPSAWDGRWTLVAATFSARQRRARLQLLAILAARGYGRAGAGLHLHPHDDPRALLSLVTELGLADAVQLFRAKRAGASDDRAFVQQAFPLRRIAANYRRFLRRFRPLMRSRRKGDAAAFALRLAVARHYLDAAWDEPGLPARLLPADWPAAQAQQLASKLYQESSRPAHRFAATLAEQLALPWQEPGT